MAFALWRHSLPESGPVSAVAGDWVRWFLPGRGQANWRQLPAMRSRAMWQTLPMWQHGNIVMDITRETQSQ